jgi:hypothetical protein
MNTPVLEIVMQNLLAEIQSIESAPSVPLFKTTGRGRPMPQAIELINKPSAHLLRLTDRPVNPEEIEEVILKKLSLGVLIHGVEGDFTRRDAELIDLAARVEERLENNTLNGMAGRLNWVGCDTPEANQTIPFGSTLVVFSLWYGHKRGQPDSQ